MNVKLDANKIWTIVVTILILVMLFLVIFPRKAGLRNKEIKQIELESTQAIDSVISEYTQWLATYNEAIEKSAILEKYVDSLKSANVIKEIEYVFIKEELDAKVAVINSDTSRDAQLKLLTDRLRQPNIGRLKIPE